MYSKKGGSSSLCCKVGAYFVNSNSVLGTKKLTLNFRILHSFVDVLTVSVTSDNYSLSSSCTWGWRESIISSLCLPVSITGDSNDALWFPVYSVLACGDERHYWQWLDRLQYCRVKAPLCFLSLPLPAFHFIFIWAGSCYSQQGKAKQQLIWFGCFGGFKGPVLYRKRVRVFVFMCASVCVRREQRSERPVPLDNNHLVLVIAKYVIKILPCWGWRCCETSKSLRISQSTWITRALSPQVKSCIIFCLSDQITQRWFCLTPLQKNPDS